jgi:hypothetical protein
MQFFSLYLISAERLYYTINSGCFQAQNFSFAVMCIGDLISTLQWIAQRKAAAASVTFLLKTEQFTVVSIISNRRYFVLLLQFLVKCGRIKNAGQQCKASARQKQERRE